MEEQVKIMSDIKMARNIGPDCQIEDLLSIENISFKQKNRNNSCEGMPDLFPLLDCQKLQIQPYDPSRLSYGLGEMCLTCNKPIVFQQTITICKCHRYCHKGCVLANLNQQNKNRQQYEYKCIVCQYMLQVFYTVNMKPKCRFRLKNLIAFILCLLICVFTCYLADQTKVSSYITLVWVCIFLSISFTFLFIFLGNLIFIRQNIINFIGSTNLQLIVSAFIGLELLSNDEDTQTDMIRT